jgi:hypothetical protein
MRRIFSIVSRSGLPFLMALVVGLFLAGTPLAAKMTPAEVTERECYTIMEFCDACTSQACTNPHYCCDVEVED